MDSKGAEQLIGMGDMLISTGNDLTRLQCAFIDTPEVEKICEFIGSQRAYPDAHLLPEYEGEADAIGSTADLDDKDALFEDAAAVVVKHQSGSTSLIQRKLRLGYNRAGRIIDQPINKNTENVPMEAIFRIASSALGGIILSSRSIKISLRLAITGPIPKNTITIKPTLTISYAPRIGMLNMNRKKTSTTTTSIIKTRPMEDIT